MAVTEQTRSFGFADIAPFTACFLFVPLVVIAATQGGWWLLVVPAYAWYVTGLIDFINGKNSENIDPLTDEAALTPYRMITLLWVPSQIGMILWCLWYVPAAAHLNGLEKALTMVALGVATGGIGITFAHEMMHQKNRIERWSADLLMASVLYSHFRSEHLLVHHRYIGTPRDPVTARYGESFHWFFPRVLVQCAQSSWRAEAELLSRKGKSPFEFSNPFWRYAALQSGFLILAVILGGWLGLGLFVLQAFVAIAHLELINYVEHYGLTREHLGDGKYEHVKPHHSWNTDFAFTNYLLINLQRHSDHHYKPDRRFPLLQTYDRHSAPQLPLNYPLMVLMALVPPWFWYRMNPKVDRWRAKFYPHITDWSDYNAASTPMPR
ncbi:MAG: alkane 1-monooxygenase [Pseudomonadota bacterium]